VDNHSSAIAKGCATSGVTQYHVAAIHPDGLMECLSSRTNAARLRRSTWVESGWQLREVADDHRVQRAAGVPRGIAQFGASTDYWRVIRVRDFASASSICRLLLTLVKVRCTRSSRSRTSR
jgi:hypothetical protein